MNFDASKRSFLASAARGMATIAVFNSGLLALGIAGAGTGKVPGAVKGRVIKL